MGFAIDNKTRDQQLAWVKELGATVIRSHYPLAPYTQERADELGIMQWSEIPVYSIKTQYLKQKLVRELAARELESNIQTNGNHPSVIIWSIANELSARPGPVQGLYIKAAVERAHALDPSRPVGIAVAGYPSAGCQPEYGPIDVIGINDYFGWYPGPNGQIADRTLLSDYLDSVRQCYPNKAIVVSEFGAEANRDGPVEEKGTYAFQQDFVNYHLGVFATKPWLSGAIYFALQEFRVRPTGTAATRGRSRRSTRRGWSPSTACASRRSSTSSASSSPPSSSAPCHDPGYDDRDGRPPASRCDGGRRREGADAGRAHRAVGV